MTMQEIDTKPSTSASMEDILTTIRNVIASDATPTPPVEEDEDILELTDVLEEGNPELMKPAAPATPPAATSTTETPQPDADAKTATPAPQNAAEAREDMLSNIDKALDTPAAAAPAPQAPTALPVTPVAEAPKAETPSTPEKPTANLLDMVDAATAPAAIPSAPAPEMPAATEAPAAPIMAQPPVSAPPISPPAEQPNLAAMVEAAAPEATPVPYVAPAAFTPTAFTPAAPLPDTKANLLSDDVMKSSAELLRSFADTVSAHQAGLRFRSGMTLEEIVVEALKPQLAEWLEKHLPNIVQRIVEREIQKIIPNDD